MNSNTEGLLISETSKNHLLAVAKWAKISAIIAFFIFGGYLLFAVYLFRIMLKVVGSAGHMGIGLGFFSVYMILMGLLVIILFFIPTLRLFQFSQKLQNALLRNENLSLDDALSKLKAVFKFWGICSVILAIVFTLLILRWAMMG